MRSSIPPNDAEGVRESIVQPSIPGRTNYNTIFPSALRDIDSELAARVRTELAALSLHFEAPLPRGHTVAARIALVGTRELELRELLADPDAFVVVGRHSEASMRALDSSSLSLRHVLLIPQLASSATEMLVDIVPLAPTVRLALWSQPLPEPLAEHCTAFILGDSLLLVAPVTGKEIAGAGLHVTPSIAAHLERHASAKPRPTEPPRCTRVSTAYTATDLPPASDGSARLVLEVRSSDRAVRLHVQEAWLARGILLGRNPDKCSHVALADALSSDHVSRCHVFLRREEDDVVFYDTASTSGVCVDDELVRRVRIPAPLSAANGYGEVNPEGVVLSLTDDVFVTLFDVGEESSRASD